MQSPPPLKKVFIVSLKKEPWKKTTTYLNTLAAVGNTRNNRNKRTRDGRHDSSEYLPGACQPLWRFSFLSCLPLAVSSQLQRPPTTQLRFQRYFISGRPPLL